MISYWQQRFHQKNNCWPFPVHLLAKKRYNPCGIKSSVRSILVIVRISTGLMKEAMSSPPTRLMQQSVALSVIQIRRYKTIALSVVQQSVIEHFVIDSWCKLCCWALVPSTRKRALSRHQLTVLYSPNWPRYLPLRCSVLGGWVTWALLSSEQRIFSMCLLSAYSGPEHQVIYFSYYFYFLMCLIKLFFHNCIAATFQAEMELDKMRPNRVDTHLCTKEFILYQLRASQQIYRNFSCSRLVFSLENVSIMT